MRAWVLGLVAACYTSSSSSPPPPGSPPPRTARPRCPPESELQVNANYEQCLRRDTHRPHGLTIIRDDKGRPQTETTWRDGTQDGVQRLYWPQGGRAAEGNWAAGARTGTWRYYYPSGTRSHEIDFANGNEVAHRAWDERGRARTLPELGTSTCTTDADCTIGFAARDCCPPENSCGVVLSRAVQQRFDERCAGLYCGPPQPSSSCMGMIGLKAVCDHGVCAGQH
jgi:hypothetical protein